MSHTWITTSKRVLFALALLIGIGGAAKLLASGSVIILEDFSTMRTNGEGDPLWSPYTGAGPDYTTQVGSLDSGSYRITIPGNGRPYFQFFPYPYLSPDGFAKAHIRSGTWSADTNRMRFWIKTTRSISRRTDGGAIAEIGIYTKPNDGQPTNQGDHYYHYLDANLVANQWMLVTLNRVPQHKVGMDPNTNWPENPSAPAVNYYDGFTRFYFCDEYGDPILWGNGDWWFKNYQFDTVTGEPDTLVSSIAAVYTGSRYEVSWAGPKNTNQSYTIRYSANSMKQNGFGSGTLGGTTSNPGDAYTGVFWASQNMAQFTNGVYIAIQPAGQTAFTEVYLPTSPDYVPGSGGGSVALPPGAPANLRIVP